MATKEKRAPAKGAGRSKRRSDAVGTGGTSLSKTERRKSIKEIEKREPLRRRILEALSRGPMMPSDLAELVEASTAAVSRLLNGDLLEKGLVEVSGDEDDRRRRNFSLTAEGEVQLNKHRVFGAKDAPSPDLDDDETLSYLQGAFDRAVAMRRDSYQLEEVRDRLQGVVVEAEEIGARHLALDAMLELTKTLRQKREFESCDGVIDKLNAISLGIEHDYDAALALPAAAHFRYALGRIGERRGEDLPTRAEHLTTAYSLYGQLASGSKTDAASEDWLRRKAWSILSLAGNLRKQTQLEQSLLFAAAAKQLFDQLEDDYGQVKCLFMFGFCLRLMGEFREAKACLQQAHDLAHQASYEPMRAESLMQLGEVRRCQGSVEEARAMLTDALELADRMELHVTQAFAYSTLGAVEFQERELPEAQEYLSQAQSIFDHCEHVPGRTLNTRRRAAVARRIATGSGGRKPSYASIEKWIHTAISGYLDLRSPAGVAACQIEDGRVQMLRKNGKVEPVVEDLKELLADRVKCKIIELDPWVPLLLEKFAKEVGDDDLRKTAQRIYRDAQQRLAERAEQGLKRIGISVEEIEAGEEGPRDPTIAEMGGETRRDFASIEEERMLGSEGSADLELDFEPLPA